MVNFKLLKRKIVMGAFQEQGLSPADVGEVRGTRERVVEKLIHGYQLATNVGYPLPVHMGYRMLITCPGTSSEPPD